MANKPQKKRKLIIGLIAISIIFLCVSIAILWKNHETSVQSQLTSQLELDTNDEDWLIYEDKDLPFTFQYPGSISFEKDIKTLEYPEGRVGYTAFILSGSQDSEQENILHIKYRDGYDSLSDHSDECFQYMGTKMLRDIKISNKLTDDEAIQICGERKLWNYNYDKGKKGIQIISSKGMSIEVFKKLIESLVNR